MQECTLLTTVAAVSCAKAIEGLTGIRARIKWVNDLYLDGKKVGGILTQTRLSKELQRVEWAVVGIGINLSEPEGGFPAELRELATALGDEGDNIKNRLIAGIVNEFIPYYRRLTEKEFIAEYSERLLGLNGEMTVNESEDEYTGTVIGIDDMCRLKIRLPDGSVKLLSSAQ